MSGIVKPDGTDAMSKPLKFKIHEVELQSPSDKSTDLAKMGMVQQRHPVTGDVVAGLAITPTELMVALEVHYALEERDQVIADLQEQVDELSSRLDEQTTAADQRLTTLEDDR